MRKRISTEVLRHWAPVAVCLLMILVLLAVPTGYEGAALYQEAERCSARVLEGGNSTILDTGLVRDFLEVVRCGGESRSSARACSAPVEIR